METNYQGLSDDELVAQHENTRARIEKGTNFDISDDITELLEMERELTLREDK